MNSKIKYQTKVHFRSGRRGRKCLELGEPPDVQIESGRVPRVSRIMALAIRFEGLIQDSIVTDQADLARLGHVSRARITQIMNLLHLAPDIQEQILFLPRIERGRDPLKEHQLRPIAAVADWRKQRKLWSEIAE